MPENAFDGAKERAALDKFSQSYNAEAPFDIKMRDYMMRSISPYLRPGNCLQLGCGHGEQTLIFAQHFDAVTVIEGAADFIAHTKKEAAAQNITNIEFAHTLAEEFDTDKKFGNIILSHVLEHVHDDVGVLSHLSRFLAPGGRVFVIVPNAGAASRLIAVKMGILENSESLSKADLNAGHRRMYHLDKLCDVMRRAGLGIEHSGGIFFKPLANFQFDALMGGDLISDEFMEGCYELGKEHPTFCASIFAVAEKP